MILLVDNYDSFSYNLYQLAASVRPDIRVVRNDQYTVQEVEEQRPEAIIISPGPGRPEQAGICISLIREMAGKLPILGVCLGHQAICEAFGGTVTYAKELMHGKQSELLLEPDGRLFAGLGSRIKAARYHSLAAPEKLLPGTLRVTARTADGEVMAVEHTEYPLFGLQFHPESVMTPDGLQIMKNFMEVIDHD